MNWKKVPIDVQARIFEELNSHIEFVEHEETYCQTDLTANAVRYVQLKDTSLVTFVINDDNQLVYYAQI